jgi:hypothetical protein
MLKITETASRGFVNEEDHEYIPIVLTKAYLTALKRRYRRLEKQGTQ